MSRAVSLGEVDPAGSRQQWRRSSVLAEPDGVVAGTADGTVTAFDAALSERWTHAGDEMAVALAPFDGGVAVGSRGDSGSVRLVDGGEERWRYETVADLGGPQKESLFFYPFVVDLVAGEDRLFAAARRYERDGEERVWTSAVYAFRPDGSVAWRFETDASPISLSRSTGGDRLAVAYNRCGGDHDRGLVVLDTADGTAVADWDPDAEGERRVGDVAFGDGLTVASHGDYRGYRPDADGTERWSVPLAERRTVGDEVLYAYPNHAASADGRSVFVTGNTFPVDGRDADGRHPNEHRIAVAADGAVVWDAPVEGFVRELATADGRVALACSQHFRDRDPGSHALRVYDVASGERDVTGTEGVVTAVSATEDRIAFVEEPVEYHDEGVVRGAYRLRVRDVGDCF